MRALSFLPLLLLLAVAGCDSAADGPRDLQPVDSAAAVEATTPEAVARAETAWRGIAMTDYEMSYTRSCFCPPAEVQVRVERGQIVEAWINGEPAPSDPAQELFTVDALFRLATLETADATRVDVFEDREPFIYRVSLDYVAEAADDEVTYTIVGFEGEFRAEG